MATDNSVTITGNATREPEVRFTASGSQVASFGVAVNRRWQNRQTNEWEESVSFFDVSCWNQLAANVAESVGRGTRVTVTGRLDQRSWETQNGEKRSKVEIVADDVAVSLRWATATVTRNERGDGGGRGGGGGGYQGGGNYSNQSGGRDFGGDRQDAPPAYNPDEEPF
ncbi:MAG: single-stranded DNA-binding protein [Acidimicrobiales bacterium]|nr:single-stranded DNA-binding protein [Acidimicrobiales bacterium]